MQQFENHPPLTVGYAYRFPVPNQFTEVYSSTLIGGATDG